MEAATRRSTLMVLGVWAVTAGLAACSSSTASTAGPSAGPVTAATTAAASTSAPGPSAPGGGGATLTLSGGLQLSGAEASTSAPQCQLTRGSVADAVAFQTPRAVYLIHVIGPVGTFTFPADTGKAAFEVFGPDHDWLAGQQRAPGSGTLTIDANNTGGRFDVQLTDINTPQKVPATVHASGTWVCTG